MEWWRLWGECIPGITLTLPPSFPSRLSPKGTTIAPSGITCGSGRREGEGIWWGVWNVILWIPMPPPKKKKKLVFFVFLRSVLHLFCSFFNLNIVFFFFFFFFWWFSFLTIYIYFKFKFFYWFLIFVYLSLVNLVIFKKKIKTMVETSSLFFWGSFSFFFSLVMLLRSSFQRVSNFDLLTWQKRVLLLVPNFDLGVDFIDFVGKIMTWWKWLQKLVNFISKKIGGTSSINFLIQRLILLLLTPKRWIFRAKILISMLQFLLRW